MNNKKTEKLKKIEGHIRNLGGKGFFIDNYELFEEKFYGISDRILKKIKEKRHTKGSQDTTLSGGRGIFRDNLARETLKYIVKTSTPKIKKKAEKLLERIDNKKETTHLDNDIDENLPEGAKTIRTVNLYERDPEARQKCINKHGYNCAICKFNFEKFYGSIGKAFIHIHHKKPLSEINKKYKINPVKDLIPVCPNCHAMLHKRKNPVYSPNDIKKIIKKKK